MTTAQEKTTPIYTPAVGSIPYRVLKFLRENPDEELTRADIAAKFDANSAGLDTVLGIAKARGAIKCERNSEMQLVWKLGSKDAFHLTADLAHQEEEAAPESSGEPLGSLVVKEKPAAGASLMPFEVALRKNTPLPARPGATDENAGRYDLWFKSFEVGDSALFDIQHLRSVVSRAARYNKEAGTRLRAVKVSETQGGVIREADAA